MFKAVIFDFDGTLADTLPICYYAFQQVFLDYNNCQLSGPEIRALFGPTETEVLREHISNQVRINEAIEDFYRHYEEQHSLYVSPFPPIHNLLIDLKRSGFILALFTSKGKRSLNISAKKLKLDVFFDVVVTGDDVTEPKPSPDGINKIIDSLGMTREKFMFLGDSNVDIEAGKRGHVLTGRVEWLPGYIPGELYHTPDFTFKTVSDCRRFFNLAVDLHTQSYCGTFEYSMYPNPRTVSRY